MKFISAVLLLAGANAFTPVAVVTRNTVALNMGGLDLSGNDWKPDSGKMGSTDTGDYFPENYNPDVAFADGMMGSQQSLNGGNKQGPALPGMENHGQDAFMTGGIEMAADIPAGMEFVPSSVPDGEYHMNVASSSSNSNGVQLTIAVPPVCMTFEDFYAAFAPASSHPSFSVLPATGRMDRRNGEPSMLTITCNPQGASGELKGDLVINLPDDNSKICYKITATSF